MKTKITIEDDEEHGHDEDLILERDSGEDEIEIRLGQLKITTDSSEIEHALSCLLLAKEGN